MSLPIAAKKNLLPLVRLAHLAWTKDVRKAVRTLPPRVLGSLPLLAAGAADGDPELRVVYGFLLASGVLGKRYASRAAQQYLRPRELDIPPGYLVRRLR